MKLIGTMNGWKDAPHCWRKFLFKPFMFRRYHLNVFQFGIFGFVLFFTI